MAIHAKCHLSCTRSNKYQRGSLLVCAAKKKGKGSKGPGKKSAKLVERVPSTSTVAKVPYLSSDVIMITLQLLESYKRETGRQMFEESLDIMEAPRALYEAPFVCLAHDGGKDPIFTYANEAAQKLWEVNWDDIVGVPSRKSAEEVEDIQSDRESALREAEEKGFVDNYSGVRISSKGKRFEIQNATLWTIKGTEGEKVGQAAVFSGWNFIGCEDEEDLFTPDRLKVSISTDESTDASPSPESIQDMIDAASDEVTRQGEKIRKMKESGMTNQDQQVQDEVAVLLELKQKLEHLTAANGGS